MADAAAAVEKHGGSRAEQQQAALQARNALSQVLGQGFPVG